MCSRPQWLAAGVVGGGGATRTGLLLLGRRRLLRLSLSLVGVAAVAAEADRRTGTQLDGRRRRSSGRIVMAGRGPGIVLFVWGGWVGTRWFSVM